MHELGISRNIVAIVSEAAKGRRVQRVTLEIGQLSGVNPEALQFSFEIVAQQTVLEGALLEVIEIAARAHCDDCGEDVDIASLHASCRCGGRRLKRFAGEELNIKTMELEDEVIPR